MLHLEGLRRWELVLGADVSGDWGEASEVPGAPKELPSAKSDAPLNCAPRMLSGLTFVPGSRFQPPLVMGDVVTSQHEDLCSFDFRDL